MRAHIQKWGNSLALRIPRTYAREANMHQGSTVNLTLSRGKLIMTPVSQASYKLKDLLSQVKKSNLHKEQHFGKHQGKEIW